MKMVLPKLNSLLIRRNKHRTRYEVFMSQPFSKMDVELLRTFILHYSHILDKTTKTIYVNGKGAFYFDKLSDALTVWHGKKLDATDEIVWAEQIIKNYNVWKDQTTPKNLTAPEVNNYDENLFEIIRQRRSIRFFENRVVEKHKIIKILDAGRWAPCSGNRQAWRFIVQKRLKGGYTPKQELSFEEAEWASGSVLIYVAMDERLYPEKYSAAMDAAAAIQNLVLEAQNLGLGTCWSYIAELTDQNKLRSKLGVEDYYYIYSAVLVGYPAEQPQAPPRKPLSIIVKFVGF